MSPSAAAEKGAFERMKADAKLLALLAAGAASIVPGFPHDVLKQSECPRITFYVFGPPRFARDIEQVRLSADLWVWPSGAHGGRGRLLEIDGRLCELFDVDGFTHAGHWIVPRVGGFRDFHSGPNEPMRRLREILLDVAKTAA